MSTETLGQLATKEQLLKNAVNDMNAFRNLPFEEQYAIALKNVLDNGTVSKDRTGVGTKRIQSQQIHINMQKEFPILQGKKMNFKSALVEMVWIMTGRNDLKFLKDNGVNYWDSWVKEDGTFGPIYGPQMRNFGGEDIEILTPSGILKHKIFGADQIKDVLNQLMSTPDSRRIIIDLWNPNQLATQALPPCFTENKHSVRCINGEYKLIENINIGDFVLSDDSKYHEVYDKMVTPYEGVVKTIKHKLNTSGIEVTPNHPFLVKDKGYVNAENLVVGDMVGITNNYSEKTITEKYVEYQTKNGDIKTEILNKPEEWYFMGYWLGNGWLGKNSEKRKYFVSIPNKKRDEILNKINGCLSLGIINKSGDNVKKFQGANYKWWTILQEFNAGALNKKIPDFITNSSPELINEFIKGYIDADGCDIGNAYVSTTVSKNIAYGIQSLYTKLNIPSKIHFTKKEPTKTILGRVVNQSDVYSIYVYKNKQNKIDFNENSLIKWSEITEISESNYNGNVHNISVLNNHTYTVNNIINHNCHFYYQLCSYVDHDGVRKLDLHAVQRSADSFLGVPYDFMLFAIYLKIMSLYSEIEIGWIHCTFNDFHMYLNHENQVKQYLDNYFDDPQGIINHSKNVQNPYIHVDYTDTVLGKVYNSDLLRFREDWVKQIPGIKENNIHVVTFEGLLNDIIKSGFNFLKVAEYTSYGFIKGDVAV